METFSTDFEGEKYSFYYISHDTAVVLHHGRDIYKSIVTMPRDVVLHK